jgi:ABC-2 type transport system ATP-binding protein
MEPAVSARNLVKRYGAVTAVDEVDLTVQTGDVYGFLGPNGAGKTTTLRILLGLVRPDAGAVRLFGRDPQTDLPAALGGVAGFVEAPRFYPYLTGRKNLELLAAFDGGGARDRIDEALDVAELRDRADDRVGGYSQGMRQRLGLAGALIRNPRLLMLDEPTHGLDPGGMRDMRLLVRRLAHAGITILLSSHLLAEVEEVCSRVAIIRTGRIVYEGSLDELRRSASQMRYRLRTTDAARALRVAERVAGVGDLALAGDEVTFSAEEEIVVQLSRELVRAGLGIAALVPVGVNLEDVFFMLTEEDRQEAAA